MKRTLLGFMAVTLLLTIVGCETIKGFGRDIANTGENIYDVATGTGGTKE